VAAAPNASANSEHHDRPGTLLGHYRHLVVIYQENHSFDNLFGQWGRVGNQQVDGLNDPRSSRVQQVAQSGEPYNCLLQDDVNLTAPSPLPTTCTDPAHKVTASHFGNAPFTIDDYIGAIDKTCPAPGVFAPNGVLKDSPGAEPGGCTRDLVHRFYQEQYQIDGGKQDRYVTGSDAVGLTMGNYDTKSLPLWKYFHSGGAPNYVLADHFFQGAFGGSFLNHQYLIAARAPIDTSAGPGGANANLHSVVDSNGFPTTYPLYTPASAVKDAQLTQACGPAANPKVACGDYAVNTMQPSSAPFGGGVKLPLIDDSKYPNIGDRLSQANVPWAWYAGGWNDANSGHPGPLFQYHHQPFNYFADYAPGQPGRAHLKDETEFLSAANGGTLPTVSFVKPYGAENYPLYTPATRASRTAATTSSTCSKPLRTALRPRTLSLSSPTTSSAASGTTCRLPAKAARPRAFTTSSAPVPASPHSSSAGPSRIQLSTTPPTTPRPSWRPSNAASA
jgi:phospholipase C